MTGTRSERARAKSAPWHLWVVGGLALVWNGLGALTIELAQLGALPGLAPDEIVYYATKPVWLVITTALATYGCVAGSLLLLLRHRAAVPVFAGALACIIVSDGAELTSGGSRAYANATAAIVTAIILLITVALLCYSLAMRRRGILR